ncbi:unnamed protein product [Musa hybrid cultivar]
MRSSTMAKRLRFRLSRVLPSGFRFKGNGAASSLVSSDVDFPAPPPPLPRRLHPPLVSASCCLPSRRRSLPEAVPPLTMDSPAYLWRKEEKWWHVVACAADDEGHSPSTPRQKIDSDDGIFPPLPTRRRGAELRWGRQRKVASRRRTSLRRLPRGGSNSSADTDSGWFSSEEETGTLMSTTDVESSDNVIRRRRRRKSFGCGGGRRSWPSPEGWPAVGRLIPCTAPAVRESFAVVKLSENPKEDFRRSMAEMVVEKEIFDARGLEQLLRCFLSLNSRHHHAAIVAAFNDIWDALFPPPADAAGAARRCSSPQSTLW